MSYNDKEIELSAEEIVFLYRLFRNLEDGFTMSLAEIAGYDVRKTETSQSLKRKVSNYISEQGSEWLLGKNYK